MRMYTWTCISVTKQYDEWMGLNALIDHLSTLPVWLIHEIEIIFMQIASMLKALLSSTSKQNAFIMQTLVQISWSLYMVNLILLQI